MFKSDPVIDEVIEAKHVAILSAEPWKGDSAQNRLLIKGGQVVNADQVFYADVYVEEGVIKQVGEHLITPGGARVIEAKGKYVIPGGIDTQTHLHRGLGGSEPADDFYTGSRAALAGGTTTLLDLVLAEPGQSLLDAHAQWCAAADQKACCDYGLHVAVTSWSEKIKTEMSELASSEHGVNSFKLFMAFKDTYQLSDEELIKAFVHCKKIGALAQVHAENGDVIKEMTQRLLAAGLTGPEGHELSRPEEVEAEATGRACMLAHQVGCPVHVGPLTSPAAGEALAECRRRGQLAGGETTAAALATDGGHQWSRSWRHAAGHVTCPPLRPDPAAADTLMALLANQDLDCVASDHCSLTSEQKAAGQKDFSRIPPGVDGIEDRMAVVWEKGVASGKMDVCQFVAVTSTNAAKLFNIYPQKGVVAAGSDADLVVWDGQAVHTLSAKTQQQRSGFTVLEGVRCRGAAVSVLARGQLVLDDGQLRVTPGAGRRLGRTSHAPHLYRRVQQRDADGLPPPVNRDGSEQEDGGRSEKGRIEVDSSARRITDAWAGRPDSASGGRSGAGGGGGKSSEEDEFHCRQAPAEGVRNQQNSGFAVSGAQIDDRNPARTGVKVHAPPGGKSAGSFW